MVESSPLLSAADGRKVTNAHRAIKFMILSAMASAVLVLLAASKSLEQTELIQWIVPKVHTASAVPLSQKMKYFYVQSSALENDMKLRQQVVEVHTPQSVKLSPVFAPSPPHSQCVCFYPHDINQLQSRIKSQSLHVLEPNQTEAPKGTIRNCAISSLQLQASGIILYCKDCRFIHSRYRQTSFFMGGVFVGEQHVIFYNNVVGIGLNQILPTDICFIPYRNRAQNLRWASSLT